MYEAIQFKSSRPDRMNRIWKKCVVALPSAQAPLLQARARSQAPRRSTWRLHAHKRHQATTAAAPRPDGTEADDPAMAERLQAGLAAAQDHQPYARAPSGCGRLVAHIHWPLTASRTIHIPEPCWRVHVLATLWTPPESQSNQSPESLERRDIQGRTTRR
jgi:hypothetical protein